MQWKEILSTDQEAMDQFAKEFQVHPLALEDCLHRDQRPKLDDYDTHQFLVWFIFAKNRLYEMQFLIFKDYLVAIPHESPPGGGTWHEYLKISDDHKDIWHFLYHVLDHATDHTWRELRQLFMEVDQFEQQLFQKEVHPQSLLKLKKQLNQMDYSVGHLTSVTEQIQKLCQPSGDLAWKFRDLADHCEKIYRSINLYRSQIVTTIELFWGLQANKTNRQIKKLTLLASISVPLTFWCSFWGMNFQAIPFDSPQLFGIAMGLMAITVIVTLWVLVRRGYWD